MSADSSPRAEPASTGLQRPVDELPVLHLERAVPEISAESWTLTLDGCVQQPRVMGFDELTSLAAAGGVWDFHCVWGWSRQECRWWGADPVAVAEAVGITTDYVMVSAHGGSYASALTVDEFLAGMFATHLDGEPLAAQHGGPVRFVPPPGKWQYKGVKWVARVTATSAFTPGFWEQVVGDPHGDIPPQTKDLRYEA